MHEVTFGQWKKKLDFFQRESKRNFQTGNSTRPSCSLHVTELKIFQWLRGTATVAKNRDSVPRIYPEVERARMERACASMDIITYTGNVTGTQVCISQSACFTQVNRVNCSLANE